MSVGQDFAMVFRRELDRLADEIAAYVRDEDIWSVTGEQKNAAGTLAVHLVGNLSAMIGASLGSTGYVRDREHEFAERDVSREEIVRRVHECRDTIVPVLEGLEDDTLAGPHPGPVPPALQGITTRAMLMHLIWHLGWHLGQIDYHRKGLRSDS